MIILLDNKDVLTFEEGNDNALEELCAQLCKLAEATVCIFVVCTYEPALYVDIEVPFVLFNLSGP